MTAIHESNTARAERDCRARAAEDYNAWGKVARDAIAGPASTLTSTEDGDPDGMILKYRQTYFLASMKVRALGVDEALSEWMVATHASAHDLADTIADDGRWAELWQHLAASSSVIHQPETYDLANERKEQAVSTTKRMVRIVETVEYFHELPVPDETSPSRERTEHVEEAWAEEPEHRKYPDLLDRTVEILDAAER